LKRKQIPAQQELRPSVSSGKDLFTPIDAPLPLDWHLNGLELLSFHRFKNRATRCSLLKKTNWIPHVV
jgi:hypothetical protein